MKLLLVSSLFLVILYHVTAQGFNSMQDQNNRVSNMNYSKFNLFEKFHMSVGMDLIYYMQKRASVEINTNSSTIRFLIIRNARF